MLALAAHIVFCSSTTAVFERVLGATIGTDSPAVLEQAFGSRSRVLRHYWSDKERCYVRDDGWNWWSWPEANAFVQIYWTPAYPASMRRIDSVTICRPFGKKPLVSIRPSGSRVGWLDGIRIGMSEENCLRVLRARFGSPRRQFNQWIWSSRVASLEVYCEDGRLCEILVSQLREPGQ